MPIQLDNPANAPIVDPASDFANKPGYLFIGNPSGLDSNFQFSAHTRLPKAVTTITALSKTCEPHHRLPPKWRRSQAASH